MGTASYSVVCDLSLRNFDDPRVGRAAAKGAFAEVRKLGRTDPRVRSTRLRRRRDMMQVSMTVSARTASEAFDLGRSIIRAGIHANGGNTEGWELVRPHVMPDRTGPGHRRGAERARVDLARTLSWEERTAAARRQAAPATALPPLASAVGPVVAVIDLR